MSNANTKPLSCAAIDYTMDRGRRGRKAAAAPAVKLARDLSGADLERLGFRQDRTWERRTGPRPNWYVKGCVRVVLRDGDEEAGGVGVYAFDEEHRKGVDAVAHGILAWEARFDGSTPAHVVTAAIFAAVES